MTLIRAVGRTLLASYFIASGVKAARKPALYADEAQPVTDKIVPLVKKYAPEQVAGYLPEDAESLVRLNGIVQIVGGLALATGKGRRVGSWMLASSIIPTAVARHPFWTETDKGERADERSQFLKSVALLGGVILAARDTEGQPGLRWLTADAAHALGKGSRRASTSISKVAHNVAGDVSEGADAALAGGLALAGMVAKQSRRTRKKARKAAAKQAKKLGHDVPKLSRSVRKQAAKAQQVAVKRAAAAQKVAAAQARSAVKKAKPLQQAAAQQAHSLGAEVLHRAADARKSATDRIGWNIELGHN